MKNIVAQQTKYLAKQCIQSLIVMSGLFLASTGNAMLNVNGSAAVANDYAAVPPILESNLDPFVMISLSVELTQQAEAYTGAPSSYCNGRVGNSQAGPDVCYIPTKEYIGYFDANKCYVYDTSGANTINTQTAFGPNAAANPHYFKPSSAVLSANHDCTGKWSGNFLNWSTMTALDEFRSAMVGGARLVDGKVGDANDKTLLIRTHRYAPSTGGRWDFVPKKISTTPSASEIGWGAVSVNPSTVTPYSVSSVTIENDFDAAMGSVDPGPRFRITTTPAVAPGTPPTYPYFNTIVQVCDPVVGLETNCTKYVDPSNPANINYKPEGVMQKNALNMKYALTSYSARNGNGPAVDGGILRANAKYIGYQRPAATGGLVLNPNAEINQFGQYIYNPDMVTIGSGVNNSGVINYMNMFGLGAEKYKGNDPVAELFYEGLRYIKNLGPTPEYAGAIINNDQKDNFPVITTWTDPVAGQCQANNMLAVGDQFAWDDNDLPGESVALGTPPSNPDTDLNVTTLTDAVGVNQGGLGANLGGATRGRSDNGWYVAGLAWYANTQDVRTNSQGRTDIPGMQTVKTYFVDTQEWQSIGSAPLRQNNPLWLAAKYGGFVDNDGDTFPHANGGEAAGQAEWDADNDNIPDTYVLASEPANLVVGLNNIFTNINDRISSGAAAAVVANSSSGTGAIYEAVYEPKFVNGPNQISWAGQLQALFIDDQSRIREDSDGDNALTSADFVIETSFNVVLNETTFERIHPTTGVTTGPFPLSDLKTIWNARDELATLLNANMPNQRAYGSTGGRYIRTWIDADADGVVDTGEEIDFIGANFPTPSTTPSSDYGRYLGVESTSGANASENIVNFTRGQEITGFRSRTIDFDGTGAKVWRLSDMIHSAPTVVGRPNQLYDLLHNDLTYAAFKSQYANRRQVVYVGANGGMLHAFNGGFYNASTSSFDLTYDYLNDSNPANDPVSHSLGAELWAYVPTNLLPHLGWLTQPDYPHVYYVDGEPQSYDVNIFTPDATHPNGWGTILVVGMRFGGGEISVDLNSDSDGNPADNTTFRSAYIIFDVTDPEQPPKLLAELTDDELGFTTSKPTVVKKRVADGSGLYVTPADNEWYLVFGSGATGTTPATKVQALLEGVSDQNAKLYAFDLKTLTLATLSASDTDLDIASDPNGFVGGLTAADWDENFVDEVVYFGTQSGSITAPTGNLKRLVIPTSFTFDSSLVTNDLVSGASQPFPSAPILTRDQNGNRWVYAGTGRLWVNGDNLSMAQQSFYGAIEPTSGSFTTAVAKASMVDTTDINVNVDGTIELISSPGNPFKFPAGTTTIPTFNALINTVASAGGWYYDLQTTSARNVSPAIRVSSSIVFSEYIPSGNVCEPEGSGFLNVVDLQTGTPAPYAAIGASGGFANKFVPLGQGVPATPVLHVSTGGSGGGLKYNVLVGQSNLNKTIQNILPKPKPSGRRSWREIGL